VIPSAESRIIPNYVRTRDKPPTSTTGKTLCDAATMGGWKESTKLRSTKSEVYLNVRSVSAKACMYDRPTGGVVATHHYYEPSRYSITRQRAPVVMVRPSPSFRFRLNDCSYRSFVPFVPFVCCGRPLHLVHDGCPFKGKGRRAGHVDLIGHLVPLDDKISTRQ
jgi:hypothetical protein